MPDVNTEEKEVKLEKLSECALIQVWGMHVEFRCYIDLMSPKCKMKKVYIYFLYIVIRLSHLGLDKKSNSKWNVDHWCDISKNFGIRASENFLFHESHEKSGKYYKNQLFRALEINQNLGAIQGTFSQEKGLNLVRTTSLWHFKVPCVLFCHSSSLV